MDRMTLNVVCFLIGANLACSAFAQTKAVRGPVELRVDNLTAPLGIDDPQPHFSWQLRDPARGATQSAYEVLIASSPTVLSSGKGDIWDSDRISSSQSMNVQYAGAPLAATKRYFWKVRLWDAAGKIYAGTETSWWETGLLTKNGWTSPWIGYETPEEAAVRHAPAEWITNVDGSSVKTAGGQEQHIAYRVALPLAKPVNSARLYVACRDTASAWVNGKQVLTADPLPPYKQMPWKKYVRADVSKMLGTGANTVALECIHYEVNPNGMAVSDPPPLSATIFVEFSDGTNATFASNPVWKTSSDAKNGWQQRDFDDSAWKSAVRFQATPAQQSEPLGHPWIPDSVKALRREFSVTKTVKSARIYSTALGSYELFLNGSRVSEDILSPGWTDYRERVNYQTYDVTKEIKSGHNAIGALLAPGWYSTPLEWFQQPNNYGDTPPALRAQLRIEFTDGTDEWVNTDPQWRVTPSYITSSEIYDGESQDSRLIQPGWNSAGFEAKSWKKTQIVEPSEVPIEAQAFPPIRIERTVSAISLSQPKPGVFVFDFGQNLAGVERVRLHGAAGTVVRLRFAEILNDDGTLYTDNLRTAKVTDYFTLSGKGVEEFTPRFTFHGFRYAEVTGLSSPPGKEDVIAEVIHTAATFDARLKTSNTLITKLWNNILWGQRSNFVGVPTDCPQRDERLGWMADAQVFWRTASYNMDLAAFSRKYSADMRGTQAGTSIYGIFAPGTIQSTSDSGAGWSDAGVIIPWTSWLQSGDTSIIEQNWGGMRAYLAAIENANPNGLWTKLSGIPFGDWLSPEGKTDQVLVATAYWAYDVTLMRQMAHATGRSDDERKYTELFAKIREAFIKRFVHSDGFIEGADNSPSSFGQINNPNAMSKGGDTQTGYVLALHTNLIPDGLRAAAVKKLVDKIDGNHGLLSTGFLGTPYLLEELTKAGRADVAYKLLLNTQYPSWGYLVEHGATTMWERWNGDQMKDDPSMNSYNHYAYGAVADWIYRYAAGVDATAMDAGFHTVELHPVFDPRLGSIDFDYDSSYGLIHSDWSIKSDTVTWHVTIPANTKGLLKLNATEASRYKVGGVALRDSKLLQTGAQPGLSGYEVPAGSYVFEVEQK